MTTHDKPPATDAANGIRAEITALAAMLTAETRAEWYPAHGGAAIAYCIRPDGAYLDVWHPNHGPACWRLWWKIATDGAKTHIFTEIVGHGADCLDAARLGLDQDRATRWAEGIEWHPAREWTANAIGWVAAIGPRLAEARITQDGHGDLWGWRVEDIDSLRATVIDHLDLAGFDIPCHWLTGEAASFDDATRAVIDAPQAFRDLIRTLGEALTPSAPTTVDPGEA